jgi:acyl-CoA synthetase (AMP-forming)/AMP-acid ligase II
MVWMHSAGNSNGSGIFADPAERAATGVEGTASADWWWLGSTVADPDQPALVTPEGVVIQRRALAEAVQATARRLIARGWGRTDRLALVMAPGPAMGASLLAAMAVAAVAPLVPASPVNVILEDLERLNVTGVLVDDQPPAAVLAAAERLGLPVLAVDPWQAPEQTAPAAPLPAADDLALLLQTSGTTSRPKVVPLSHANLRRSAQAVAAVLNLGPDDRSLAAMPLFHIHGIVASLLAALVADGSVICCRSNDPTELLRLIGSLQPSWLSAVPTLLQGLLQVLDQRGTPPPPHRLRLLRSSSSPLPPAVLERLEVVFRVPVLEAYGMTEAAHQICSNRAGDEAVTRRPGSVGPAAGPEITILSPAHVPLPAGQAGEVAIRGANVTAGYEAADLSGWITASDGSVWFLTGDEGWLDGEGRLTLTGRLKEMINRGGEKVIPRRVDEVLLRHPAVDQALAFAVPHPTLGEDLAAAVVLRQGESADEQELRRHAFAVLAPHEVPSRIVLLADLPRGPTGKPQRIGLAARIADQLQPEPETACGALEELIAGTAADVLQREPPARDANLFLLGCDSLSGMRLISTLAGALGRDLDPALLFAFPTVRSLAEQLGQSEGSVQETAG